MFGNSELVSSSLSVCTNTTDLLQVLKAYETLGFEMLLQAFNDEKYLEKLTGLDQLYAEGQAALESVDWDEEDSEEGEGF